MGEGEEDTSWELLGERAMSGCRRVKGREAERGKEGGL